MITFSQIPVDIDSDRLARLAEIPENEAILLLENVRDLLHPAGAFDEISSRDLWGSMKFPEQSFWEETAIAGYCHLGPVTVDKNDCFLTPPAVVLFKLALNDSLDYMEYRIRQYLRPTGREPGVRLIPGCPNLPAAIHDHILHHFNGCNVKLFPLEHEALGTTFVYPASVRKRDIPSGCAGCSKANCPTRLAASSMSPSGT